MYIDKDKDEDGVCEHQVYANTSTTIGRTTYVTLPQIQNLPGGRYKWAVKVQGDADYNFNTSGKYQASGNSKDHSKIRPACANPFDYEDNRYKFQYPKGLAVNTYHDSPYLGASYVGEAGWLRNLTGTNHRTGSSRGIYVFGPNLGQVWSGQTYKAFTGNLTGGNEDNGAWCDPDDTKNKYFGPNRVTTDKDGYVYIAENRPTGERTERIWRVHHSNLKSGTTPTFSCILSTNNLTGLNISNIKGRVFSMSIGYEGDDKLLYIISGNTSNAVVEYAHLTCWKITENPFKIEYTDRHLSLTNIKQGSTTHILKSPQCSVVPGNENGDLWIFQRTDAHDDIAASGQFSALHLSKDGDNWVADYHIPSKAKDADDEFHQNSSGTGAISTHHVLGNTSEYYLAMPCRAGENSDNPNGYVVKIFRMYKNNTGLHRARWWNLYRDYNASTYAGWGRPSGATTPATSENIDGIAFDPANNLFFGASSRQRMFVYALPKENWHMTYGPTELHIPYKVTSWEPKLVDKTNEMKTYMFDTDPMPVLSKDGWVFEGWYDNEAYTGEPLDYVNADNLTLYAKWTEIKIHEHEEADNEPILKLVDGKTVGMKVDRKMPGGSFSTLCLPFAINAKVLNSVTWDEGSDLTGNPLEGATLWTFSGVETDAKANTKTLVFTQTNDNEEVPANTPFLILPQNDVPEDIFFHNVHIEKATELTNAGEVSYGGITFHGFINPVLLKASPNNFFLVANNRLATSYYDSMLPALRGYFTNNTGSQLLIRTQQGTPSLLDDVNSNIKNTYKIQKDGKIYIVRDHIVYDLQGNRVAEF